MKQVRWIAVLALLAGLGACGGTEISDQWKDPNVDPRPAGKIAVVGLTTDAVAKRVFEDTFAKSLRDRGNDATASYSFIEAGPSTNPDSLVSVLRTQGYSCLLYTSPSPRDS